MKIINSIKNLFKSEKSKTPTINYPPMEQGGLVKDLPIDKINFKPEILLEFDTYDRYGEKYIKNGMNRPLIFETLHIEILHQMGEYNEIRRLAGMEPL